MGEAIEIEGLNKRKILTILKNPAKGISAANLIYVSDTQPGIRRVKRGKRFCYVLKNKKISDAEELLRIKHLVIPPAWRNVWICPHPNGHLQATGYDVRNRKQYRYHASWNALRSHTKFYRLHEFGECLPKIREQITKDLSLSGLPLRKVLAVIVSLMEQTCIRVGNCFYEKLYGSYGLTTLKDQHVSFRGEEVCFMFRGKKGVKHKISLKNKKLSRIIRQCRDIPGKELFQYIDEDGKHKPIDSGMVNEYIKTISGHDFTTKDFRTWSGTVQALVALKETGRHESIRDMKLKIVKAIDRVAAVLGNTRSVCRKYYVHPLIIRLYEKNQLEKHFNKLKLPKENKTSGLNPEEQLLLKLLESGNRIRQAA